MSNHPHHDPSSTARTTIILTAGQLAWLRAT